LVHRSRLITNASRCSPRFSHRGAALSAARASPEKREIGEFSSSFVVATSAASHLLLLEINLRPLSGSP
jgi:hypothetical protein